MPNNEILFLFHEKSIKLVNFTVQLAIWRQAMSHLHYVLSGNT